MRLLTRPGLALAIAVAVFALPTIASGALSSPSAPAANSTTYQDSVGDAQGGPDITSIVVSNDDTGMLTFLLNIANRPPAVQGIWLDLYVDTDSTRGTGDPIGVDYVIQLIRGEVNLYKWDGSEFTRRFGDPSAVTLSYSYTNALAIRISASELGKTKAFGFYVDMVTGVAFNQETGEPYCPTQVCPFDDAPGGGAGFFPYEVKITPPTLVVKKFSSSPKQPQAGKPFTLRLVAARSDTGAVIQNGRVTCVGRVGKARLKAQVARVVAGAATCTWNIPANASGKAFRGSVTVAFEGLKAAQAYSGKVR